MNRNLSDPLIFQFMAYKYGRSVKNTTKINDNLKKLPYYNICTAI